MRKIIGKGQDWERKLNINTIGRDASREDEYHYPYEPTPYSVLEYLVESDYISEKNVVIDYGCGKGRVGFFLHDQLGCKVVGIDFNEQICKEALKNLGDYRWRSKCLDVGLENEKIKKENAKNKKVKNEEDDDIEFFCESAERYEVQDADVFYFFNPFSVKVLQSVIGKIRRSYYETPRQMRLFFYYPSDEYVSYLMQVQELCFFDEIDCSDLFMGEDNPREKILIFEML